MFRHVIRCLGMFLLLMPLLNESRESLAVEGKWTPEQLLAHDRDWLTELGLEMPAEELWDPEKGGLLQAIVQIGGCSAGFVSAQGLAITNHHCIFGILQEHSTPENDLIANGFLASGRETELPATGVRATVPVSFRDVTVEIEKAAEAAGADDLARFQAIDRRIKELVGSCEEKGFRRCQVAVDDDGVRYRLVESLEYPDTRLVYAPPLGVGEYGGEVDNWSWPRHTGDFALIRVYADGENSPSRDRATNRPFQPARVLEMATDGVSPGSFVMVTGYPGRTYRALVAEEMAERYELFFPRRSALYQSWLAIMHEESQKSEAARIALADRTKGLANREKNSRGQVAGISRGRLLDKKRQLEQDVLSWAKDQPEHRGAIEAHRALEELAAEHRAHWDRDFLLDHAPNGPALLRATLELTRYALEREKPDLERQSDYQERNRDRLLAAQKREQKRIYLGAEQRLLTDLLERLVDLPETQRLKSLDRFLSAGEPRDLSQRVADLLASTQVADLDTRLTMFEESAAQLRERQDPFLDLAFDLNAEILAMEEAQDRRQGAFSRLRPVWRRALATYLDRPLDPDANGTLRVSLAHVQGYEPRDAVWMKPQTTLGGVVQKHTGESPFATPASVLEKAPEAGASRWASPALKDIPVGFLATGDTTGGNSGSPVLDGKGRLVGVNFDRVWENVANDFGYNPEIARNVSVDLRYLLWMLEEVAGASALLEELGIKAP